METPPAAAPLLFYGGAITPTILWGQSVSELCWLVNMSSFRLHTIIERRHTSMIIEMPGTYIHDRYQHRYYTHY